MFLFNVLLKSVRNTWEQADLQQELMKGDLVFLSKINLNLGINTKVLTKTFFEHFLVIFLNAKYFHNFTLAYQENNRNIPS